MKTEQKVKKLLREGYDFKKSDFPKEVLEEAGLSTDEKYDILAEECKK